MQRHLLSEELHDEDDVGDVRVLGEVLVLVGVSYATEAPAESRIAGLTYATVTGEGRDEIRASWNRWDVINTILILLLILSVYLYFTG